MAGAVGAAEPGQPPSWRCWLQPERISMPGVPQHQQQQQQAWDRPFWAALALLLAACVLACGGDAYGGAAPSPSASTHITLSSTDSTGAHAGVRLHSSVASVDLSAGKLALDLHLRQHTTHGGGGGAPDYCERPRHLQPVLLVGSTAAPEVQLLLPLCKLGAEHSATLVLPLQQQSHPHPLDTHAAELRLALAPSSTALLRAGGAAGRGGPDVSWTASWAAAGLQLDVARHSSLQARLLEAVAGAGGARDGGGWGSGLGEALLPGAGVARGEVVMALRVRHSTWVRVVHLTAAVLQLLVVGGCCLLVTCQCLCAYLMQRLMCNRVHGLWC